MAVIGGYAGGGGNLFTQGNRQVDLGRLLTAFLSGRPQASQVIGRPLNQMEYASLVRQIMAEQASAFTGHTL